MATEPMTLILAEDDEGHASLVQRNLKRAGFVNEMVHVKDGQEALDFIRAEGDHTQRTITDFVLLLLDINMPRLDGVEVLRRIKCYDLGCSVYLTKPVEYEGFIEAINRLGLFLQVVKVPRNGGSS